MSFRTLDDVVRAERVKMMNPVREPIHVEPKGWGREIWIANNDLYCGKILDIRKGKKCSLHYHKLKRNPFISGPAA